MGIQNHRSEHYTVFIGDIHGCFHELQALLKKIRNWLQTHTTNPQPQFILLGDLIGKGPHAYEVVKWAYTHQPIVVMGNHELNYLQTLHQTANKSQHDRPTRIAQPPPTYHLLKYYQNLHRALGPTLHHFITSFPLYHVTKNFIAVHAGLHPTLALHECPPHFLTNVRTVHGIPWHNHYTEKKLVCYGHWAQQGILIKPNSIGLDSGCVYGGKLSAYILETQTLIQVTAAKRYAPIEAPAPQQP